MFLVKQTGIDIHGINNSRSSLLTAFSALFFVFAFLGGEPLRMVVVSVSVNSLLCATNSICSKGLYDDLSLPAV